MQNKKINIPQWIYLNYLKTINGVKFTRREIDVIACILSGKASKIIATFLSIAPKTVEAHTHNIMLKLECNSREGIIEFIEKSGNLPLMQKYYLNLLIYDAFKKGLEKTSHILKTQLPKGHIICWPLQDNKELVVQQLEQDLKSAGINFSLEIQKGLNSGFKIEELIQSSKKGHVICIGPKDLLNNLYAQLNAKKLKIPLSKQNFIFLDLTSTDKNLSDRDNFLQLETGDTYYSFFLKILKMLLPDLNLAEVFSAFFSHKDVSQENSDIPHPQGGIGSYNAPSKKLLPKKYVSLGVFMVFLTACILGFAFKDKNIRKAASQETIRSDLLLPPESILLKRSEIMDKIKQKLKGSSGIQVVALVGAGGSGKSIMAKQIAKQYLDFQEASIVQEINAETKDSLITSFKNLLYKLIKEEDQQKRMKLIEEIQNSDLKEKQIMSFVQELLEKKQNWLLIYDNLENFSDINNYFPRDPRVWGNGKIIITTRDDTIKNTKYIDPENTFVIGDLDKKDALTLFVKIRYDCSLSKLPPGEEEQISEFLKKISPFALDIYTAAYYLKNYQIPYGQYLEEVKKNSKSFEDIQKSVLKEIGDYTKTSYGIITLSLKKLIEKDPGFKELLFYICLLDSQKIPEIALGSQKTVSHFIRHLKKDSLITNETVSHHESDVVTFSLHRSTQEIGFAFFVNLLTREEKEKFIGNLLKELSAFYKAYVKKDCEKLNVLSFHLEALMSNLKKARISEKAQKTFEKEVLYMLGYTNYECTRNFILAKKYFSRIVELTPDSQRYEQSFAVMLKDLASVCSELNDFDNALLYSNLSIKLCKRIKNSEILHAENLTIMGSAYRKNNNFEKANQCFKEALSKISKLSPQVKKEVESDIYGQLASLYSKTYLSGPQAKKSEEYAYKALAVLGGDHLFYQSKKMPEKISCSIAKHKRTLGQAYSRQGKYKEAIKEGFQEGLYIINYKLDSCSHDVLLKTEMQINMAEVFLRQGNLHDAEKIFEEHLDIFEKLVGESPTLTGKTLRAEMRIRLGKLQEAYKDCLSVINLETRKRDNYADLMYLTCFYHAAVIKYEQGDFKKSLEHFSDFFKHAKEFCRLFFKDTEKTYSELELKGVFNPIRCEPRKEKKCIKECLDRSAKIFSAIYGSQHAFLQGYVLNT